MMVMGRVEGVVAEYLGWFPCGRGRGMGDRGKGFASKERNPEEGRVGRGVESQRSSEFL